MSTEELLEEKKMLNVRYIYNKKRQLRGCVVADHYGQHWGWSFCHPVDRTKMTKKLAFRIAFGRYAMCTVENYGEGRFRNMRNQRWQRSEPPHQVLKKIEEIRDYVEHRDTARHVEEKGVVDPSVQVQ